MNIQKLNIQGIPAIVYGEPSEKLFLFIHGKCGYKEEAKDFAPIACNKGYQVLSFDLPEHGERSNETGTFNPWHAVPDLKCILSYAKERWSQISIRANSMGVYFSMLSFSEESIHSCLFVSPILDMERLIGNLLKWSGVTEEYLEKEKTIPIDFGETLYWEYFTYVREHRVTKWDAPTFILYGSADNLVEQKTVETFVSQYNCRLTVVEGGEHWFHTKEQLEILKQWTEKNLRDNLKEN